MIEIIPYAGWSRCCRLANESVELIVTLDVGPRIIRFGFVGGENIMREVPEDLGQVGGDEFRFYGGHRLWHAPEEKPRTYYPDNQPIEFEELDNGVRLTQPIESTTGIQKEIEIRLSAAEAEVDIRHRLRNKGLWAARLAPWALTALAPGGTAFIPLPPGGDHATNLLPTNALVLWAYTDLSDPRWTWGHDHIELRQDQTRTAPQKIGLSVSVGWLAYAWHDSLFIKRFPFQSGGLYPDRGSSSEVFTNHEVLELESLGPLLDLGPDQMVEHDEVWELYRLPALTDTSPDHLWQEVVNLSG